mmetsp:Transcript_24963/g.62818  ORF Transcript_24963/g.62818 Transcript_24963/m.62818 type:complete len:229 (+) Transcript_24963:1051-1737(+)
MQQGLLRPRPDARMGRVPRPRGGRSRHRAYLETRRCRGPRACRRRAGSTQRRASRRRPPAFAPRAGATPSRPEAGRDSMWRGTPRPATRPLPRGACRRGRRTRRRRLAQALALASRGRRTRGGCPAAGRRRRPPSHCGMPPGRSRKMQRLRPSSAATGRGPRGGMWRRAAAGMPSKQGGRGHVSTRTAAPSTRTGSMRVAVTEPWETTMMTRTKRTKMPSRRRPRRSA